MLVFLKDEKEIEGFVKAGKIAGRILAELLSMVKPGATTNELDQLARRRCEEHKVRPVFLGYEGFPAAICTSVNEALVHGVPNDRPLENGDLVSIDIGVDLDGFIGDTAFTVIAGTPTGATDMLMIKHCGAALNRGIEASRPGNRLGDIGAAVSDRGNEKFGLVTDYGGHGVNRGKLHAEPFVSNDNLAGEGIKLRPGMVIAIEPMLVSGDDNEGKTADDGWTVVLSNGRAVHCEHTIAITENGPLILTERE